MKPGVLLTTMITAVIVGGCTTQEMSRNIYEGARVYHESQRGTPREQSGAPMPSYDQYERERRASRQ